MGEKTNTKKEKGNLKVLTYQHATKRNASVAPYHKMHFHFLQVKVGLMMESWDNSPDRYLLELGGVTTERPTEQQQQ